MTNQLYKKITNNAALIDVDGAFPKKEFKWIGDAGLLGLTIGNLENNLLKTASLLQTLKRIGGANLSVGRIYEGHVNALQIISLYGNEVQKKHWFAEVQQEKKLFGVWNTQADGGIKIHDLGDGFYRLEGSKTFCSGSNWINRPLITGEMISADKSGWQMCIIPTEKVKPITADPSFWKPLGMRASASFKMDFTGIEIEEKDLLGNPNEYFQQPHFSVGVIRFAAVQLGGAEAIFSETQNFLQLLGRTDDPFQRARMAEMAYLIESGNLWLNQAGNNTDTWLKDSASIEKLIAYAGMMRTVIAEICTRVMHLCELCVGARGLMRPNNLERIHRDLTFYLRQPAPDATITGIGAYVLNQGKTDDIWS